MFKNKNKKLESQKTEETLFSDDNSLNFEGHKQEDIDKFYLGARGFKDYIAPSAFDRGHESHIQIGEKVARSLTMTGFPLDIEIGWLSELYNYQGDLDVQLFIEPTDDRLALDELTNKIAQYESQLMIENERGSIRNITALQHKVNELYKERALLERNQQNLFQVSISTNLYADDLKELKNRTQKLDHKLKGNKIVLQSNTLRQDEGYKSALPFNKNYVPDIYRNFNTGSVVACFPFYSAEMFHSRGIYLGRNLTTGSPVFLDLFDRGVVNNSNATIFGDSGSGKSVFASALISRGSLRGIRTTIIDPEGEYVRNVEEMGGANIIISPESKDFINILDLEEEDELDADNYPTGKKVVLIKEKISDILNMIGIMLRGELSMEMISIISFAIEELYSDRGMNSTPESLYEQESIYDENTGDFHYAEIKKKMPTFSDFHDKLKDYAEKENNAEMKRIVTSLRMFKKGGVYGMFDCETSENLKHYRNAPVINFDISKLEHSVLRPLGMYIALTFAWEKFGKKNIEQKKMILVDEAWILMNDDYSADFCNNLSRRVRKRNCGFVVASQKFNEFASNEKGAAVLTNSATNIFLKTKPEDCVGVQEKFKLSDGEVNFLLRAKIGEVLIHAGAEAATLETHIFNYEKPIFFRKKKKQQPKEGE